MVSPKTLKLKRTVRPKVPATLAGATSGQAARTALGASGIAWLEGTGQFALAITGSQNVLYLDRDLVPVRYAAISQKSAGLRQGMFAAGGEMLVAEEAPRAGAWANQLRVYDLEGQAVRTVRLKVPGELESVFEADSELYACVYVSKYRAKSYSRDNHVYRLGKLTAL